MNVNELRCKNCEGKLDINASVNGVLTCPYCRSKMILPKSFSSTRSKLLEGEQNLETFHFDDAYIMFQKATELEPDGPEGYFGMALATAKVQYLKDVTNGEDGVKYRFQPICYDVSSNKFVEDKNYLKAIELASPEQRVIYKAKAEEIDYIRNKFFELKNSGLDYDTFICVKVTTDEGNHTEDSTIASKLYHELRKLDYKPFYSEEEMSGQVGSDYEAMILYALYCAKSMIIVCTNEAYLQTPWVRNEYSRYNHMLSEGEKEDGSITFVFKGKPVEKLPNVKGKIQGIDFNNYKALQQVLDFVDKFSSSNIPTIQRKDYAEIQVKKKQLNKQAIKKRDLGDLKGKKATISELTMLKNAEDLLKNGDYVHAQSFCNNILGINPSLSDAYFISFLAENKFSDKEKFVECPKIDDYSVFEKAIATRHKDDNSLYDLLEERVKKHKNLSDYEEYIALPDSDDESIATLTSVMFKSALESKDETVFNSIIRTIKDTDLYLKMNTEFLHILPAENRKTYYDNILSIDPSNQEALYETFLVEKNLVNDDLIYEYCDNVENQKTIEEQVFAYGYNNYAVKKLTEITINKRDESGKRDIDSACSIFDFLLSMIPKQENEMFKNTVNSFLDYLYDFEDFSNRVNYRIEKMGEVQGAENIDYLKKDFDKIAEYINLVLSIDPFDHNAYFNRFLVRHKVVQDADLMKYSDELLDDEDYLAAINTYTEKFPNAENYYLELNKAVADCAKVNKYMVPTISFGFDSKLHKNDMLPIYKKAYETFSENYLKDLVKRFNNNYGLNLKTPTPSNICKGLKSATGELKLALNQTYHGSRLPRMKTDVFDNLIALANIFNHNDIEKCLKELQESENDYYSDNFKKKRELIETHRYDNKLDRTYRMQFLNASLIKKFFMIIGFPLIMLWKAFVYVFGREGWDETRPQRYILLPASFILGAGIVVTLILTLCGKFDFWLIYAVGFVGDDYILIPMLILFSILLLVTIYCMVAYYREPYSVTVDKIMLFLPFIAPVLISVCLGMIPLYQSQVFVGEGYLLRITSGEVRTCYIRDDGDVEIEIPEELNGKVVITIDGGWIPGEMMERVTKVTISTGLTTINSYAFSSLKNLNEVVFKDTSTGWHAGSKGIYYELKNPTKMAQLLKSDYRTETWKKDV